MKRQRVGPRPVLGEQGLSGLGTWRIAGSADVRRRRRQTHELRREHRLHAGGRPDTVLGVPAVHWTQPAKLGRKSFANLTARGAEPKHRTGGGPSGGNVLDRLARKARGQRRGGAWPRTRPEAA